MGLLPRRRRDPNVQLVALAAAGVPLAAYLATGSAHDYWLDAGELTAAAVNLDIAHPPGHPLASLWGKLFSLIPLGPLPFRVALGQAVAAAVAAAFLYRAIDVTVRVMGAESDRLAVPIALGGTWLVTTSYAFWFQAVRPEVYALQAMLLAVFLERVVTLEAEWPTLDVRPLYHASLALGLGLANHHLMAFLLVPAIAPTLARVYRAYGLTPLLRAGFAVAVGLAAYVYLPIRAATDPPANLGDPDSLARLYWVVSAQVYAHDMGLEAAQPLAERYADALIILVENLQPVPLVLALAGLYAMLRTAGARRIGFVWAAAFLVNFGGRAWLGSVRSNPDILGQLLPGIMAVGALASAFIAAIVARLGQKPNGEPNLVAFGVALLVAAVGLAQLRASAERSSLAGFHATDDLDREIVREVPYRSVVLLHSPQLVFRHWSQATVAGARPDLAVIPLPFLGYPGVAQAVADRHPDLAPLLRSYLLDSELSIPALQSLAARRPVMVEMDLRVQEAAYETLVPGRFYYSVLDAGTTTTDITEAHPRREAALAALANALDDDLDDEETQGRLLWLNYVDALYYARQGARDAARTSVGRAVAIVEARAQQLGLEVAPVPPPLSGLQTVLGQPGDGPMDVRPFRMGGE